MSKSSASLRLRANRVVQRLLDGHAVLFDPDHAEHRELIGVAPQTLIMIDPMVGPIRANDVVLLTHQEPRLARVAKVRAHQLWLFGEPEPAPIDGVAGVARTAALTWKQRLRLLFGGA